MNQKSKDAFDLLLGYFKEFEKEGTKWCTSLDIGGAARARGYAKKIVNDMRVFVDATITEAGKIPSVQVEVPKEEPIVVAEPVVAPKIEQPVVAPKVTPVVEVKAAVEEVKVVEDKSDKLPGFSSPKNSIKK